MSLIKSFSVGNGDMFYIRHSGSSFTIIDSCMSDENIESIISEIKSKSSGKKYTRFISTHPDDDHIRGIKRLNDEGLIRNFYCVKIRLQKVI